MYIDVERLKQEKNFTQTYNFQLDLPHFMLGQEKIKFIKPVSVSFNATFTKKDVSVKGSITAQIERICHRCLDNFIQVFEIPFEERFVTANQYNELTEKEKIQEDINWYKHGKINIEPLIEQALYLQLPMKAVCKEDCLGLCMKCGSNLNLKKCGCKDEDIDPRLAVLQQLLKK